MWYNSGEPLSQIKITNMRLISLWYKTKKAFTVFIITKIQNSTDIALDSKTLKGQNKFQVLYAWKAVACKYRRHMLLSLQNLIFLRLPGFWILSVMYFEQNTVVWEPDVFLSSYGMVGGWGWGEG